MQPSWPVQWKVLSLKYLALFSGTDMRLLVLPVLFLFEVHRCFVSSVMECVITAAFLCWAQQGPTHLLQAGGQAQAPGGEDEEEKRSFILQWDPGDTHTAIHPHLTILTILVSFFF